MSLSYMAFVSNIIDLYLLIAFNTNTCIYEANNETDT